MLLVLRLTPFDLFSLLLFSVLYCHNVKLSYHTIVIADLMILVGVSVNESVAHGLMLRRYVIGTVVSWSVVEKLRRVSEA